MNGVCESAGLTPKLNAVPRWAANNGACGIEIKSAKADLFETGDRNKKGAPNGTPFNSNR